MTYPNDPNKPDPSLSYPGMQPAEPVKPKKKTPIGLAVLLLVLVAGAVGFFVWQSQKTETAHAKVGDCIQVKKADNENADTNQISCDDPAATYKVTEVIDGEGKCDVDEQFFQTFDKKSKKVYKTICMLPNVKAGECVNTKAANGDIERIACDDPKATHKVLKVDETKADPAVCESPDQAMVFAKRHVTYCAVVTNAG